MRVSRFLVVLSLVALAGSVACSRGPKTEDEAALKAAVTRAHEAYVAAINSNAADGWLATLADDVVYLVPNRPPIVGKGEVGAWLAGYLEENTTHWSKPLQDLVVAGDWAVARYTYAASDTEIVHDTSVDSGGTINDSGWGLIVYHRGDDGGWRVARDAWGSDRPAR